MSVKEIARFVLMASFALAGIAQERATPVTSASVTVRAVDGFGNPLSNVKVESFVDEKGHDRSVLFHGSTAKRVPFGQYRVTVEADNFRPSTFYVDVVKPSVLLTTGLEWYGLENDRITGRLSGNLSGFPNSWSHWWCQASGLYSRLEYESAVNPDDLHFDFGEVPPGIYLVACVGNQKFVAVRAISIAADAAPFTIDYKSDQDVEAVKH